MNSLRTLGVIPARLASTRFPRKMLCQIAGRPMLWWVVKAAQQCTQLRDLIVATDSEEIAALCRQHDWPVVLTSADLASGSDRVHAVAQSHSADIYVNIQGDEPLLRTEHLDALLAPFASPNIAVTTLRVPCAQEELPNPNAVKVVCAADDRALYFSRAAIPFDRDGRGSETWKHLGFYAYRAAALERFHSLPPSPLECAERLEQLRFLENGIDIHVARTEYDTVGVDTEEDRVRAERILLARTPGV